MSSEQVPRLLEEVAQLDRQARSDEALDLLENCAEWPAPYNERGLLLRAAILMTRDPIAALDELPEDAGEFTTPETQTALLLTSAHAYIIARNWRAAQTLLDSAAVGIREGEGPNRHWLAYLRAFMQWSRREYDPNSRDLALALQAPDVPTRFNAMNLRSWMYCGLEDYRSQVRDLLGCIRLYDHRAKECRVRAVASTLQSIVGLGWEMRETQAMQEARSVFERLPWTPGLSMYRFLCLRAFGWHAFLDGDARADGWLTSAIAGAPTSAWELMAHADRAYIAWLSGNEALALKEVSRAEEMARGVDWQATRYEERSVLFTLGAICARTDLARAQHFVAILERLYPHSLRADIEASHEPRRNRAHHNYVQGRVQQMTGNRTLAVRLLEDAYNIFSEIHHAFRAALAAQALYEVTGDQRWAHAAMARAAAFPNSAVAREIHCIAGRVDT